VHQPVEVRLVGVGDRDVLLALDHRHRPGDHVLLAQVPRVSVERVHLAHDLRTAPYAAAAVAGLPVARVQGERPDRVDPLFVIDRLAPLGFQLVEFAEQFGGPGQVLLDLFVGAFRLVEFDQLGADHFHLGGDVRRATPLRHG
jgi:hypothetical protein